MDQYVFRRALYYDPAGVDSGRLDIPLVLRRGGNSVDFDHRLAGVEVAKNCVILPSGDVKRDVKRPETSVVLGEMRASVFVPSRFMVSERCFIGETALNEGLVSYFLPIHVKCEMRGRFLK